MFLARSFRMGGYFAGYFGVVVWGVLCERVRGGVRERARVQYVRVWCECVYTGYFLVVPLEVTPNYTTVQLYNVQHTTYNIQQY